MRTLLLLLLASTAMAADFDGVRAEIRRRLAADNIPSLAVAVAKDGKILWEEGFGWADREHRIAATPHTPYSLASISKPITATALMTLVQAGKVKLDDPVNTYLGDAPLVARTGDVQEATVRRVAGHTAGLPLHYQFFYEDEPYRQPPMEETIRRYGKLVSAPGELYQYSNLGFGILDHIITRVSGRAYATYLRNEVLLPLGMTRSAVGIPPGLQKEVAVRYDEEHRPLPFYDFDHPGGSAVYASAHDLVRFGMFHLKTRTEEQKAILTDASIDEMQVSGQAGGRDAQYGIGWRVERAGAALRVAHSGSMGGVRTTLLLAPREKVAIVALCNFSTNLPEQIAGRLWREVVGDAPAGPAPTSPAAFRPDSAMTGTWKGTLVTYAGETPAELRIDAGGDVRVRLGEGLWSLWNNVTYRDGYVSGLALGEINTEDARRRPHNLLFTLRLRDGVLGGAASAVPRSSPRPGNALTSWAEFRKP